MMTTEMEAEEVIIAQTQKWIREVVVGCNFCPFAAREVKRGSIHFHVLRSATTKTCLESLAMEFQRLDNHPEIETTLLILPDSFGDFYKYLDLAELADKLLSDLDKEGIYQIASFHPLYLFAGTTPDDPSNYTNRSVYPMLHILREESMSAALDQFPHPEKIPQTNIAYTKKKGLEYMKSLRASCLSNFE